MAEQPLIAITPGDPEGIGPEIVWKALRSGELSQSSHYLCIGAEEPFRKLKAPVILTNEEEIRKGHRPPRQKDPRVWLLPAPEKNLNLDSQGALAGHQSGWSIEKAVDFCLKGMASALVTGPISKTRLNQGGYPYPGHTEFLASLCSPSPDKPLDVTMMLANDQLRVSLVTTHVALNRVSKVLSHQRIRTSILQTIEHLRKWWKIEKPYVGIAALNPHAGEDGMFGDEESKLIEPVIRELSRELSSKARIQGPIPADTLFAKHIQTQINERFDAVVCMYHDQGLIPVKLLDFPHTVNVTLGLPIIRTSVDHGVGFDIAGKNKADPRSFTSAVQLAVQLSKNQDR